MEAQAVNVTSEGRLCPYCGEPVDSTATPAAACPFRSEPRCPLLQSDTSRELGGSFDETIAYHDGSGTGLPGEPHDLSDGFPAVDDLVGTVLGLYRIEERIGRGSMGRVYRGEHLGLGRTSAVKVLSPGLIARQPKMVEGFRGEARAVAGLAHPNIVTVHNIGQDRGYHYIEMEYVAGGHSLKEGVVRNGAFESIRAAALVRQVALALAAAHRGGLVHRDVKPANVLLTPEGQAKLADFGLVRKLAESEAARGPLAGTPTFMAPELFTGAPPSAQTDLYAVGVMFYYLITARLPFASEHLGQLIRMHRRSPVPDPRKLVAEIPDEIVPILMRLLAKKAADRYDSAEELAEELKVVSARLRDTGSLVREALDGLDGLIQQGARDAFRVIVPVPGDRLQEVYIEGVDGPRRERLLSVYSVCAPADPRNYEFALKLNSRLTYGSLSIREVGEAPMFVMTRTFIRGHLTAADLRAAVNEIARRGDWVEQQLTSTDLF